MSIDSQNSAKISHIIGIDFGTAKIGLALADLETKIASAYKTIENDKNFIKNLAEIAEKENVKIVILGKLGDMDKKREKSLTQRAFKIEDIGIIIEKELGVRIEYQEEMFTTKMAEANLKERGAKKIKDLDNEEAARIILQDWMDNKSLEVDF